MSYTFYPGCSLEGTAKDFHRSTLAVAAKVGLDLPEIEGWICCGSTAAHNTDPAAGRRAAGPNLQAAQGRTVAVACAACYSRLKMANHHIAGDPAVRARVARVVGSDYDGLTPVRHLLEILGEDMQAEVAAAVRRPLSGLEGRLLLRLPALPSAGSHAVRRRREPHAHGPAAEDRRGHPRGLAAQDRVLRGQLLHHRLEHHPGPRPTRSWRWPGRRRGLHRHRLPALPAQSRHAPEGHRGQTRAPVRPAGLLLHPTSGPGHGLRGEGAVPRQPVRRPAAAAAVQGARWGGRRLWGGTEHLSPRCGDERAQR